MVKIARPRLIAMIRRLQRIGSYFEVVILCMAVITADWQTTRRVFNGLHHRPWVNLANGAWCWSGSSPGAGMRISPRQIGRVYSYSADENSQYYNLKEPHSGGM